MHFLTADIWLNTKMKSIVPVWHRNSEPACTILKLKLPPVIKPSLFYLSFAYTDLSKCPLWSWVIMQLCCTLSGWGKQVEHTRADTGKVKFNKPKKAREQNTQGERNTRLILRSRQVGTGIFHCWNFNQSNKQQVWRQAGKEADWWRTRAGLTRWYTGQVCEESGGKAQEVRLGTNPKWKKPPGLFCFLLFFCTFFWNHNSVLPVFFCLIYSHLAWKHRQWKTKLF